MSRFAAFQYRDFTLLWFGHTFSTIGTQMQDVAISWHLFRLLQGQTYELELFGRELTLQADALGLGSLGLARVASVLLFALFGGALADAFDRRKLMLVTESAAMANAGILALLTLTGNITLSLLYLITAIGSALKVLTNPAQQSIIPNLVPERHLSNAISLNTLRWQGASIIGPGLTGVLIGLTEVGVVYAIDALSFAGMIVALLLMKFKRMEKPAINPFNLAGTIEGLRFTFGKRIIAGSMILDFIATFFSSARTMLPIMASDVLGVGAQGFGILATAQSAGAIIAGIYVASLPSIRRQGAILLGAVAVFGAATALFGISDIFLLSYIFLALTGASDMVSTVIRNTVRQLNTPDRLRGRMTGVNMLFAMGGPNLGEMEAGAVAALWGAPAAIVSGGLLTIAATGLIGWGFPTLRKFIYISEEEKR